MITTTNLFPILVVQLTFFFLCAFCAPLNNSSDVNFENYDEVYDQRQNGSENYKVNVDGVVLVWAAPESLFSAATLLDPGLFGADYPDVEDILSQSPEKPQDLFAVKPDRPSTSTTILPPSPSSSENVNSAAVETEVNTSVQHQKDNVKRKFRLPGFMRPFMTRRVIQQ